MSDFEKYENSTQMVAGVIGNCISFWGFHSYPKTWESDADYTWRDCVRCDHRDWGKD